MYDRLFLLIPRELWRTENSLEQAILGIKNDLGKAERDLRSCMSKVSTGKKTNQTTRSTILAATSQILRGFYPDPLTHPVSNWGCIFLVNLVRVAVTHWTQILNDCLDSFFSRRRQV